MNSYQEYRAAIKEAEEYMEFEEDEMAFFSDNTNMLEDYDED